MISAPRRCDTWAYMNIEYRTTYYITPIRNDQVIDNSEFLKSVSDHRIDTVFLYPRDIVVITTDKGAFRCDPANIQLYKYFWEKVDKDIIKQQVKRSRFPRKQFKAYLKGSAKTKWKISKEAAEWYMALILGGTDG